MSQINPFMGSILQAPQATQMQAADKDRQVRRAQDVAKNSALTEDQLEHQVESTEALTPTHDPDEHDRPYERPQQQKRKSSDDDDEPESHLDLTA